MNTSEACERTGGKNIARSKFPDRYPGKRESEVPAKLTTSLSVDYQKQGEDKYKQSIILVTELINWEHLLISLK